MKTKTLVICDKCNTTIEPRTGFIVQGNIYILDEDLNNRGGLVGNAFPEQSEDGTIMASEIKEVAYHADCLYAILNPALKVPAVNYREVSEKTVRGSTLSINDK